MLVNFAHDSILVYDKHGEPVFGSANIVHHDIYPEWIEDSYKNLSVIEDKWNIKFPITFDDVIERDLFGDISRIFNTFNIIYTFDNYHKNLRINSVDYFYERKINFIYPIFYYHPYFIEYRYDTLDLPDNLIKSLSEGIGKIGFFQPTEGTFGERFKSYEFMCNLSKRYNLKKEQLLIVTSNLKANETYESLVKNTTIEDRLTIYPYDFFANSIWFNKNGCFKFDLHTSKQLNETFYGSLEKNKTEKKEKHFLCLNRITRPHRMIIFGELMTNPKLINKSYLSLGKSSHLPSQKNDFYNITKMFLADDYKRSKQRLLDFYENYNSEEHYVFDEGDLENNKAGVLNLDAQNKTFVNIVTETLTDSNVIFFSEKIYKPINCAQPFILIGNPYSLKKLKEKGYMTFDKWWDESYDEEENFTRRFEKIMDVIEEISSWDMDKCFQVTNEMESVLIHNFNTLMSNNETINFYKFISTEKRLI